MGRMRSNNQTGWQLGALVLLALTASAVALAALALPVLPSCPVGDDSDLSCARGFQARERDGERRFRWSDDSSAVVLSGAGYGRQLMVEIELRSGRPADSPAVPAAISTRAGHTLRFVVAGEPRRYRLLLRPAVLDGDRLRLQIASATFAPGSGRRTLGLIVAESQLLPMPGPRLPGLLLILALLGLGLATTNALQTGAVQVAAPRHAGTQEVAARRLWPAFARPPTGGAGRWLPLGAGVATIAAVGVVIGLLPARSIPYLPALTLIVGAAVVLLKRQVAGTGWRYLYLAALLGGACELVLLTLQGGPPWLAPLLLVVQVAPALLVCGWFVYRDQTPTLATLLGAALTLRLTSLGLRLLSGNTYLDGDVDLFFAYGMALREIGLPVAEYPSGALLTWAGLTILAGDSRERFALLLPLLNLLCDLGIVAAIMTLGRRLAAPGTGSIAAAFYALSPLLLPFGFAKYDPLPTLLLVWAIVLAAWEGTVERSARSTARRTAPGKPRFAGWPAACWFGAGLLIGLGGAIKWTPLLAGPLLGLFLLRTRRFGCMGLLALGGLLGVALPSLPFALADLETFLAPYRLQGGRAMTGQSIWFLLALPLDPELLAHLPKAWSSIRSDAVPVRAMVVGQAVALLVLAAPTLLRRPDLRRTLALAALLPASFLLLNRVYSPQYMLTISAALLVGATLLTPPARILPLLALLALTQAANLVTWPLLSSYWLLASALMFGTALTLLVALAIRSWLPPTHAHARGDEYLMGGLRRSG